MNSEIISVMEQGRDKRQLLAIYRDELPQSADYTGFPVLLGSAIAVIIKENDFVLDGYVAVRLGDINYLEQVDGIPFIRKIVTGEKLYDAIKPPKLTDADSWHGLLGGVQASFGGWLTVESCDEDGCCFFMGVIARLDPNFLYIYQVDADGTRHQEETTIPLQDIVTVAFGSRYIELYRRYRK